MLNVSRDEILDKMRSTNRWWTGTARAADVPYSAYRPRAYFEPFLRLAKQHKPVRALLLMGPRRVGKTVLLFHVIKHWIEQGHQPQSLLYLDVQQPVYSGISLENLLRYAAEASGIDLSERLFVCFDEIQYLRDWERHLKALVDSFPQIKFVASGSAAAALKLKSTESGAGRFTDFLLPPLTFYEYLDLMKVLDDIVQFEVKSGRTEATCSDINILNEHFIDYLNYGGYPEALSSPGMRADPGRFIRSDIIDKVLLKDLPSLYGIQDIQEMNSLFTSLAYNTAQEISLHKLSQKSGVSKNTIKRYIEYLESAFLIRVVHRIDRNAKRFQRANFFKVYLTNPSMRAALFSPISADDPAAGPLVETAIFAQWFHSLTAELHYARWNDGEVDIVYLNAAMHPEWAIEVKWTDRFDERPDELRSMLAFCRQHPRCKCQVTTITRKAQKTIDGLTIPLVPASLYCLQLGYNAIHGKPSSAIIWGQGE